MDVKLTREQLKILPRFGFKTPEDIDLIEEVMSRWGTKTFYNLGAIMGILSRTRYTSRVYEFNEVPKTGPIGKALKSEYPYGRRTSWMDHASRIHRKGEPRKWDTLVVSPYDFDKKDAEDLIRFCDKYNLTFHIGQSMMGNIYFPGHTLDIFIDSNDVIEERRQSRVSEKEAENLG